jgi:hypothetical protein
MADDVILSVKQINEKIGEHLYILHMDDMLVATTTKAKMDAFLKGEDSLVTIYDDNLPEVISIYGLVLDPKDLPFEIPDKIMKERYLWLLKDEGEFITYMAPHKDIKNIASEIEYYLSGYEEEDKEVDIDDFAVILGMDIGLSLVFSDTGSPTTLKELYE